MDLPDETTRQERIRRIIDEYKQALRQGTSLSVNEILARNADVSDELRSELRSLAAETRALPEQPISSRAEDMTTAHEPSAMGRAGKPVMPGTCVGDYRLIRELGRGGMGIVYEAEHIGSDRRLAVKLLSPNLPHTEQTIARFLNEASLAAGLSHPRSTFVYEAGESDGKFFISMELMPGRTLKDVVASEGGLSVNRAVDYILDVLEGLDAAHKSGVVHRDVKPSNCFLDEAGRVKVGDFGLSKSLVSTSDLTLSGTFLGTPQFAAPEQFGRGKVDHRTDVFATAATLYYLIAGEAPFQGDAAAVIAQIVADDPAPLHRLKSEVPASLSRVVARALSKDPLRRYKDANEFRNALMPYATGGTSTADLGRRLASFLLDVMLVTIVTSICMVIYLIGRLGPQGANAVGNYAWVSGTVLLIYFVISEGLFSRSLGKMWLGLRVVDQYGESPGIPRSILRSIILPGLSWVSVDVLQSIYNPAWQPTDGTNLNYSVILMPQFFAVLRGVLCLVACSSMRRGNGFRGLHELASGTRVIRPQVLETLDALPSVPDFSPVLADEVAWSVGRFSIVGSLATIGSLRVLAARDSQLERPVWIFLDELEIPVSRSRRQLTRATRPRWLGEGTQDGRNWQAFEAIGGAPLPEVTRYTSIPWGIARNIWLQAAEELRAALDDGTLPEELSIHQMWTDARGRLRLCDRQITEAKDGVEETAAPFDRKSGALEVETTDGDNERAMRLLVEVAEFCTRDDESPAEALDLRYELAKHSDSASSPRSVVDRLRKFVDLPYRLRWDDRLGSVAISAGIEVALFSPLPLFISSVLTHFQQSAAWTINLSVTAGLGAAALVGYFMRGGLAFWLTGVAIRTGNRPASRGRCAIRNVVAWLPLVLLYTTIGITLGTLIRTGGAPESPLGVLTSAIYQAVFAVAALLGIVYAVLRPRRGLQDLLSGTFLVRRVTSKEP